MDRACEAVVRPLRRLAVPACFRRRLEERYAIQLRLRVPETDRMKLSHLVEACEWTGAARGREGYVSRVATMTTWASFAWAA